MSVHRALAPAKVNLGLCLGPRRAVDGRHELVSVMQSISLADELTLELAPAGTELDEVICPGVPCPPGENLAAAALQAFRAASGWSVAPLRLSIVKRIPVGAGLGGGSADAAAALRLARHASGLGDEDLLRELAAALGADVPAQVSPGRWLASGAGERLHALGDPGPALALFLLPAGVELSTAAVYAEAERLGLARTPRALSDCHDRLRIALELGAALPAQRELLRNDLEPAAVSLCPQIVSALERARAAGAEEALLSGSGPTVVGLFARANGLGRAERAVAGLEGLLPAPIVAHSVDAAFGRAQTVDIVVRHNLGRSTTSGQTP
jgi:4-diphosphocytidyl-2-C-methyl-D-erythritol kinase